MLAGEVVEIVGRPSSGRTSLLTTWLTAVTARAGVAALVDADDVFDPRTAECAGVDARRLLWVRCHGQRRLALRAADLLLRCPGFALVALDLGESAPRLSFAAAFRLRLAARRTDTALIILAGRRVAGPGASLTLLTERCSLNWSGPPATPTRLARMATAIHILRHRGHLSHWEPHLVPEGHSAPAGSRITREARENWEGRLVPDGASADAGSRSTREAGGNRGGRLVPPNV